MARKGKRKGRRRSKGKKAVHHAPKQELAPKIGMAISLFRAATRTDKNGKILISTTVPTDIPYRNLLKGDANGVYARKCLVQNLKDSATSGDVIIPVAVGVGFEWARGKPLVGIVPKMADKGLRALGVSKRYKA
jgi:hypothetical protein